MIVLAGSTGHIPLTTRLLVHPVVDVVAEAAAHLVIWVLHQVFREVAGALASSDRGDHPGVPWYCLGHEGCRGPRDHEVAWLGIGKVGGEGKSGEGQGGIMASSLAVVVVHSMVGTVGVEVFHGAIDGFVHWRRECMLILNRSKNDHTLTLRKSIKTQMCDIFLLLYIWNKMLTSMLLIIAGLCLAGRERHPWQYPEVGVQWGRHDQALWWGYRCNGHLSHIGGRDVQWLCFAGCSDPPHLSSNKQTFAIFSHSDSPTSSAGTQPPLKWLYMSFLLSCLCDCHSFIQSRRGAMGYSRRL